MKSFAKLSVLLALIATGRYIRLSNPTALQGQEKPVARLAKPDSLQFATFTAAKAAPVTPVSHRAPAPDAAAQTEYVTWY